MAADRASRVSAHGEAERHLRSALRLQRVLEPQNQTAQCDLLLALGQAIVNAGETGELIATEVASQALAIADGLGDRKRAYEACFVGMQSLAFHGGIAAEHTPEYRFYAEGMQRYAAGDTVEQLRADTILANALASAGRETEAREFRLRAMNLSRRLANSLEVGRVGSLLEYLTPNHLFDGWSPATHRQAERLAFANEFVSLIEQRVEAPVPMDLTHEGRIVSLSVGVMNAADAFLTFGQRSRAEAAWHLLAQSESRGKIPFATLMLHRMRMIVACLNGNFEDVRSEAVAMIRDAEALGSAMLARASASAFGQRSLLYSGHVDEALAGFPEALQHASVEELPMFGLQGIFAAQRAVCLAHAERFAEADAIIDHFINDRPIGVAPDETPMPVMVALLEASVLSGHKLAAQRMVGHLQVAADLVAVANTLTVIARHLSAATLLLGDRAQALAYAEQALALAEKVRFRPEVALTRLQLAEVQSERAAARAQLEQAVPELRAMDMRPGLRRGLELLEHS